MLVILNPLLTGGEAIHGLDRKTKRLFLHLLCPNWLTWLFWLKMTYRGLLDVLAPSKRMIEMEGGFLHLTTSDKIRLSMKVQSFLF